MNTLEAPHHAYLDVHPIETLPKLESPTRILKKRKSAVKTVFQLFGIASLTILFACPFITLLYPIGEMPWNITTGLIAMGFSLLCAGSKQAG